MRRILSVLSITLAVGTSLACAGATGMAADMAADAIEKDPEAKKEFLKSFRDSFSKECAKQAGKGKKSDKAQEVCDCAAESLLKDKSVKELMGMLTTMNTPEGKEEMVKVVQDCAK